MVDASLAVKWFIREERTDEALALIGFWSRANSRVTAPALFLSEFTNAIYRYLLRGELDHSGAVRILDDFLDLRIDTVSTRPFTRRAFAIAHELGQGAVYDAHYLALAEALGVECWTADGRLYRSAVERYPFIRLLGAPEA